MSYERREIPGHTGYFADTNGVIWSQWRRGLAGLGSELVALSQTPDSLMGYGRVAVKTAVNSFVTRRVHVLVALTFIGPRSDGLVIRHLNGDHADNRPVNLAYGTYADNAADTNSHGRKLSGEGVGTSKLKAAQIAEIRDLLANGRTLSSIGATFGVTHKTIAAIRDGRSWNGV